MSPTDRRALLEMVSLGEPAKLTDDAGAAAIASALAPFIYADSATVSGLTSGGTAFITLEAIRQLSTPAGPRQDSVAVAHLRMDLRALGRLKAAIAQIEVIMAQPGPEVMRN